MSERPIEKWLIRETTAADGDAVRTIVATVLAEYGLALDLSDTDSDLKDVPSGYHRRGGSFKVIVRTDGRIVGCGGLMPRLNGRDCEIRKMYLLREARGHGLGKQLLGELVREAAARNAERVVLDTLSVLKEARTLYESFGFKQVPQEHVNARHDLAFALELRK
jgi:putative acetyltransferase